MGVLDFGCGPGDLTSLLAELVGESGNVNGVDPSKKRIAIALKKTRPNLSFHEGRAEDLSPILSASVDVVFVNSTFHWVKDQPAALDEFARVLKPGGRVGMSGGSADFVAAHEKIKADVLSREPYKIYPEEDPPRFLKRRDLRTSSTALDSPAKLLSKTHRQAAKDVERMWKGSLSGWTLVLLERCMAAFPWSCAKCKGENEQRAG